MDNHTDNHNMVNQLMDNKCKDMEMVDILLCNQDSNHMEHNLNMDSKIWCNLGMDINNNRHMAKTIDINRIQKI